MRIPVLAIGLTASCLFPAFAQTVPGGCEVHNNDSLYDVIDLPQEAIDLFCSNGMSARTYCSALTIDVGLPDDFALMFRLRDESAINFANSLVVMFLRHMKQSHDFRGTKVKVNLFTGTHRYYAGKKPIATATERGVTFH